MKIKISSDSTCDLNKDYLEEHNVACIPLYTIKDGETFRDCVDIYPADIFSHVAAGGNLCSTAALNIDDYTTVFSGLLQDCDALIHINISSDFSSCYQNACIAAQEFENVYVIDSRNLSTGHGHIVCQAVRMVEEGVLSPSEIAESLREITSRVEASFVLDQLEYLRKGGRCSALAAMGANLLSLKPCIEVKDGKMNVGKKYRGKYKNCLANYVKDRLENRQDIDYSRIFITYTANIDRDIVDLVKESVQTYASFDEIIETTAGCTVSCHCGPNTLGILFIRSK